MDFKMNKKDNMDEQYIKNSKEMQKKKKEKENKEVPNFDIEVGEDATQYGEFISSYFAWIPLPKQKERAEELDNMTKGQKKSKK